MKNVAFALLAAVALLCAAPLHAQMPLETGYRLVPAHGDHPCVTNRYELFANGVTHRVRWCNNGILSDVLQSAGAPGGQAIYGGVLNTEHLRIGANAADASQPSIIMIGTNDTTFNGNGSSPVAGCYFCKGSIVLRAGNGQSNNNFVSTNSADGYSQTQVWDAGWNIGRFDGSATFAAIQSSAAGVVQILYGPAGGTGSYSGYHRALFTGSTGVASFDADVTAPQMRDTPLATPPYACDAGHEGYHYSDTSHAFCWCDGSAWQKVAGAGTCA